MKRKLKVFVCTLILVCLVNPAFAAFGGTEYYVDFENGSDAPRTCTDAADDECKTLQYALDTVTAQAGGSRINVEYDSAAMTQTLTATIDIDINAGTQDTPIIVQGYSATVGDGTRAVIDGDSTAVDNVSINVGNIWLVDLELKGSTDDAIAILGSGDNARFFNLEITNAGGKGVHHISSGNTTRTFNCEITGTTGDGWDSDGTNNLLLHSYLHDITGQGIYLNGGANHIVDNVIDTTANHNVAILNGADSGVIVQNTFYNATGAGKDNLYMGGDEGYILVNNIFNTSNDDSIDTVAGTTIQIYYNNVVETTDITGALFYSSGESTADPGFEGAAGGDFNIGSNMDDIGFDASGQNTATAGTTEPGAYPYEETGGGASEHSYGCVQ